MNFSSSEMNSRVSRREVCGRLSFHTKRNT
nr:MAG TPA: hypothetical protein [Caudoviricetes sp.]